MVAYTTTYNLKKPTVADDEDVWGGYLNDSMDLIDDVLDGTTPVTGIDINSGTIGNITIDGDLSFTDNTKAIFGAGSDLQIYHDGSNSYVKDAGSGELRIRGTDLRLQNAAGTANYIRGNDAGDVGLYYNGGIKLATTSTGIDVTGTVTADGLTVNTGTTGTIAQFRGANTDLLNIDGDTDAITLDARNVSSLGFEIQGTKAMQIGNAGDISFYEDTGTTAKFFWDASAESLGIGTSSPSALLHASSASNGATAIVEAQGAYNARVRILSGNANSSFLEFADPDDSDVGEIVYDHSNNSMRFNTNAAERMRIDSSGSVGIGISSPSGGLHVKGDTNSNGGELYLQVNNNNTTDNIGAITFGNNVDTSLSRILAGTSGANNSSYLTLSTSSTGTMSERMRIDSSGRVGIGTSSPSETLDVSGNIAVSGNVDGRDVAADGSKLDGIESGATADQTASEILTAIKTVDGSGSGLDADNLDGYTWDSSGKTVRAQNFYADDWFRNYNAGEGLYNEATGAHFVSDGSGQWTMRNSGSGMNLLLKTSGSTTRGSLYATSSNEIGLLDSDQNWAYKHVRDSRHEWFINNSEKMELNSEGLFLHDGSLAEDYDALSGTSPTCNVDNGGAFSLTMSGNTTFTFSGANSGYSQGFVLQLTGNGSTVTWPSSVDWAGGTAPDAPASGETDIYVFWTRDGGTTWYGVQSIDAAA